MVTIVTRGVPGILVILAIAVSSVTPSDAKHNEGGQIVSSCPPTGTLLFEARRWNGALRLQPAAAVVTVADDAGRWEYDGGEIDGHEELMRFYVSSCRPIGTRFLALAYGVSTGDVALVPYGRFLRSKRFMQDADPDTAAVTVTIVHQTPTPPRCAVTVQGTYTPSDRQMRGTVTAITVVPCDTAIGSMNVREVIGIQVIGPDELLKLLDLSHQPIH
jgi:hypothetical protein